MQERLFWSVSSPSGQDGIKHPWKPLGRLLMHDSGPLAPGVWPGATPACWRLREGFTFRANARLKICRGTAREIERESGPAARVDELGSSVFSMRTQ
jgi:hypothetical protein